MAKSTDLARARAKYGEAHTELVESIEAELKAAGPRQLLMVSAMLLAPASVAELERPQAKQAVAEARRPSGAKRKGAKRRKGKRASKKRGLVAELKGRQVAVGEAWDGLEVVDESRPRVTSEAKTALAATMAERMGERELDIPTILAMVEGELPAVGNPREYVGRMLNGRPEFKRVGQGVYRVAKGSVAELKSKAKPSKKKGGRLTADEVTELASYAVQQMGRRELDISAITELLVERVPSGVKDVRVYVAHLLRTRSEFELVERGVYRVKGTVRRATQSVTEASAANAARGRDAVARGDRPVLKQAMVVVMGKRAMSSIEVVEALKARGWLPSTSDPRQYVSYMLSANTPETFERTDKRGVYRVRGKASKKAAVTIEVVWAMLSGQLERHLTARAIGEKLGVGGKSVAGILGQLSQRGWVDQYEDGTWMVSARGKRNVV